VQTVLIAAAGDDAASHQSLAFGEQPVAALDCGLAPAGLGFSSRASCCVAATAPCHSFRNGSREGMQRSRSSAESLVAGVPVLGEPRD